MKKPSKQQVTSKTVKFIYYVIGGIAVTINQAFSARGVMEYITGMTDDQKIIASIFVVSLLALAVYTAFDKIFKQDK